RRAAARPDPAILRGGRGRARGAALTRAAAARDGRGRGASPRRAGARGGSAPGGDGVGEDTRSQRSPALRLTLKLKLTLLITSLLVVTVLLVSLFLVRQEQESLTAEMTKRGLTIAKDLANASKNPILSNDDLTLSLLVEDAMKDPDVTYVIFTDADGKVVGHPDLGQIGRRIERTAGLPLASGDIQVTQYVDPKRGRIFDFAVPLVFSKVRVGSLYLGFSRKSIEAAVAHARNSTVLISAAMIVVGIGGALG